MSKFAHAKVLDFGLNHILTNCSKMVACDSAPTSYDQAMTDKNVEIGQTGVHGVALAQAGVNFTGISLGDGSLGARELPIPGNNSILVSITGVFDHVALVDETNQELLYVTQVTNSQQVYAGNTLSLPTWKVSISQPA